MASLPLRPLERFSDRVENYAKYRPGYPAEILDVAIAQFGLTARSVIADIGAGTGIFSRLLLSRGNRVLGVEPNAAMREILEESLASDPHFTAVDGTAEATTLPDQSVDLITAAQAFHWFDLQPTRAEFARILRPGGWVMLVWNERRESGTPFLEAYERLLAEHGVDYLEIRERTRRQTAELKAFFDAGTFAEQTLKSEQLLDQQAFEGRVLSSSFMPGPEHAGHSPLLQAIQQIFSDCEVNGTVKLEYETRLYYGRVTAQSIDGQ
ncbi:class I SAM-dependent methyltransferase [Planctomicrobium sp. SH664]|uniref:class I SAM-dependent methyltransferase n=1 Tax=Planctomicrobium sp. SH664 TaxID=3448125 RepID=UPI003F5BEB50